MRSVPSLALLVLLTGGCGGNPNPVQILTIGSSCSPALSCGTAPHFFCDETVPFGECGAQCSNDGDCPTEGICIGLPDTDGGVCRFICDDNNQCRINDTFRCVPRTVFDLGVPDAQGPGPFLRALSYCAPADLAVAVDAGVPVDAGDRE